MIPRIPRSEVMCSSGTPIIIIRRPRTSVTEALTSSVAYTSSGAFAPVARASCSIMPSSRGWSSFVTRTPCGWNRLRRGKIDTRIVTPRTKHVSVTHRLLLPRSTQGRIAAASSAAAIRIASV
jgi:hypothetical protein